jgi:membrane-bound serine protease (ClpP class)
MRRLLGALGAGLVLWSLPGPVAAAGPDLGSLRLDGFADPNVALLLLIVGIVGIAGEAHHPGAFVPGIVGAVALVLGLVMLGSLPTNWGAVGLLGLSLALFLLELHLPSHGILGAGAVLAFLLGGLLLFARPSAGDAPAEAVEVNRWLLLALTGGVAVFFLVGLRVAWRTQRLPVSHPLLRLDGVRGVAAGRLAPNGMVRVLQEPWSAVADGAPIEAGEAVEVVGREGLTLCVRRAAAPAGDRGGAWALGQVRPGLRVERIT